MTACTNNGGSRARRAVTAALVGVLSVGAAPMVALATTGGAGDVATMSVSPADAWVNGTVTYAYDNDGYIISDPEGYQFSYDGRAHHILPQTVMPEGATSPVAVDDSKVWFEDANGEIGKDSIVDKGTYYACVPASAIQGGHKQYTGILKMEFSIVGRTLSGSTIFDAADDDITDSSFTYTGQAQDYGFVVEGVRYDFNGTDFVNRWGQKAFDVEWWDANSNVKLGSAPTDAGSYFAVLKGADAYDGSEVEIGFKIAQLDLSSADIFVSDVDYDIASQGLGLPKSAWVNGVSMGVAGSGNLPENLSISWAGDEPGIIRDKETYQLTVAPAEGNENVTGSKTVSFKVVDTVVAPYEFTYDNTPLNSIDGIEVVRTHVGEYFAYEKLSCSVNGALEAADVTITDAEGNVVKPQDVNSKAGTYTLTISFPADDYAFGLEQPVSMTIRVMEDDVMTDADLTYTWNGDVVEYLIHPSYDGEDVLPEIGVDVKSHGETLTEGEDYDVVVKDANGQEVDQIVDAGIYTVTVVSDTYDIHRTDLSGNTLTVVVHPMALPNLQIGSDQMADFGDKGSYVPYTGEDASYYFYYTDAKGEEVRLPDGVVEVDHFNFDDDFADLSSIGNWYQFWWETSWTDVDWQDVDAINAVGQYVPSVKIADGNYFYKPDITTTDLRHVAKIDVRSERVFTDVSDTDFFAQEVYQANEQGYIGGVGGTTMFAPYSSLTRADMACVLYRMAGGEINTTQEGMTNEELSYISSFEDVDPNAYYAKAVAWANKMGIAKGYGTTFGTERYITVEEYVTMLARYAAACGDDTEVDTEAVLAGVEDGDKVGDPYRDSVAWAVEKGYVAKDGNLIVPQEPVARWRAVIIAVRYQPEQLSGDDVLVDNPALSDQDANRDN